MRLQQRNGCLRILEDVKANDKWKTEQVGTYPSHEFPYPSLSDDKAENILTGISDDSIDCIITDPPYGIGFEQHRYHGATLGNVKNDTTLEFLPGVMAELSRVLKSTGHLYVFTRWDAFCRMSRIVEDSFGELSSVIVWDKDDGGHGMGDLSNYAPRHEFIMYVQGPDAELDGRPPNVIRQQDVRFTNERKCHPTQKPRALMETLLEHSTSVGDYVLDPFGGVYPVARAAMRMARRAISCDLDPDIHRAGVHLVDQDLQKDPEYELDWREVADTTALEIIETSIP